MVVVTKLKTVADLKQQLIETETKQLIKIVPELKTVADLKQQLIETETKQLIKIVAELKTAFLTCLNETGKFRGMNFQFFFCKCRITIYVSINITSNACFANGSVEN